MTSLEQPYYKTNPMPVTSLVPIITPKEGGSVKLIHHPGSYFYSKKSSYYEVVRLIELRADSIHVQVIGHTDNLPTLDEVKALTPVAWHLPLPLEYLFSAQFVFIGSAPLKREDFKGYEVYRSMLEWYSTTTERQIKDLMWESKLEPLAPATISYVKGEVVIEFA